MFPKIESIMYLLHDSFVLIMIRLCVFVINGGVELTIIDITVRAEKLKSLQEALLFIVYIITR